MKKYSVKKFRQSNPNQPKRPVVCEYNDVGTYEYIQFREENRKKNKLSSPRSENIINNFTFIIVFRP